jgi:pyruvate kinase
VTAQSAAAAVDGRAGGRARPTFAKIVATIGPASDSPETIGKLIEAGVSVFRLNFSHGGLADHEKRVKAIRGAAEAAGQPIAILGDLQGPKIRVGTMAEGVTLERGQEVVLTVGEAAYSRTNNPARLPSDYAQLADEVHPGHRVLINDGAVRLLAIDREKGDGPGVLRCRVTVGGLVTSRKGINLPDSDVKASAITEQDWRNVEWAVAQGLDFLALSFVRTPEEVIELRKALMGMCPIDHAQDKAGAGALIPVIAKIEKPEAVERIDEIIEAADGIMVARGDLGVEMDLAEVPLVQKRLIAKCDEWGKPCIVATQMLETMIENATPTRAEVSDVANAILDGADAVMLSAETASGKYPVVAVETMRRIIASAEKKLIETVDAPSPAARLMKSRYRTAALAHGAWHVARDIGARLAICWSQEGGTARYLSQTGMTIPIVAYSSDERQVRRMALLRGVTARLMDPPASLGDWNLRVEADLLEVGWLQAGDPVVLVAGKPLGVRGSTCSLAIHYTGNRTTGFMRA